MLLLDAGDGLTGPQVNPQQRVPRAELVLAVYRLMRMDAMALGEKDREAGVDLRRVKSGGVVTRAGVSFGVFAADLMAHPNIQRAELERQAAALRKRGARVVIALLHGGRQLVKGLLEGADAGAVAPTAAGGRPEGRIDFAVVSHSPWGTTRVERAGETWLVETPPQGKMAGRLDLHVLDGKLEFVDVGSSGEELQRIHETEQEIAGLAQRFGTTKGPMRDFWVRRKAQLEAQIVARRALLAQVPGGPPVRVSWIENQLVALGTEIADAPAVLGMIEKYKKKVGIPEGALPGHAAHGTASSTATASSATAIATATGQAYLGLNECRRCHEQAYQFWRGTKHAAAWRALIDKGQYRDPACVVCHVTAGSVTMPDVQCEACHGPGAQHGAEPNMKGRLIRDPPDAMCTGCHHAPQAKEWEFATFRAAIVGQGHGAPAGPP